MCGMYYALWRAGENVSPYKILDGLLNNRGPNIVGARFVDKQTFHGYVLWHQGKEICQQPVVRKHITLLFNGDLFNVDDRKPAEMSDSEWLTNELMQCQNDDDVMALFRSLEGPFSVIFYNSKINCVYFGRDALGRNSLLIERNNTQLFLLSTSFHHPNPTKRTMELPPLGLYKLNVLDAKFCKILPWQTPTAKFWQQAEEVATNCRINITGVSAPIAPAWLRIKPASSPAYDFYTLINNMSMINMDNELIFKELLKVPAIEQCLDTFDQLLSRSMRQRLQTVPYCRECVKERLTCDHAKIAIFFSGGIDCTILALLADKFFAKEEPIELVNVAFETEEPFAFKNWLVPDRITAQMSFNELLRLCPHRNWKLVKVNIMRVELKKDLKMTLRHLIYPLNTVLDESLGSAFWYAATQKIIVEPKSSPRVVLVGSGADELFGGYRRHRNAYNRCDEATPEAREAAVLAEMEMDWARLPSRNLARDDRVIGDTGKTSRAPFIEEHLVQFARSLQANQRCCFALPDGIGDKLLLRLYGFRLGLRGCTTLKKRAIQFGSRVAIKSQNATDQSEYLKYDVQPPRK